LDLVLFELWVRSKGEARLAVFGDDERDDRRYRQARVADAWCSAASATTPRDAVPVVELFLALGKLQ
jgi:uncharacterized protein YfaQ (DUF2300 family)